MAYFHKEDFVINVKLVNIPNIYSFLYFLVPTLFWGGFGWFGICALPYNNMWFVWTLQYLQVYTGSVLEHRQIKLLFLDRLTAQLARYTKPDWTPYWTTPLKTTTEFVFVKECELAKMQLILNVDLDFLTDHHLLSP